MKFDSLNELVDYHRESSVSRSQDVRLRDMPATQNGFNQKPVFIIIYVTIDKFLIYSHLCILDTGNWNV